MTGPDPLDHGWWLASRAAGIVALLCITVSVAIGLAMAGRVAHPRLARGLLAVHQQTALAGLDAIAVHGITLLGDRFLDPGLAGIAVPFVIRHEPVWTGLGVTAGWLAALLGLELLDPESDRSRALAPPAPRDDRRLRAVGRTRAGSRDRRRRALDAAAAARDGRAGAVPVRDAGRTRAEASRNAPLPHRGGHARERRRDLVRALEPVDGRSLPPYEPGQFVPVAVDGRGGEDAAQLLASGGAGPAPPPDQR